MQIDAQNTLNYNLSLNYQESVSKALLKRDGATYAVEIKSIALEFNLSAAGLSQKQFETQNEWKRIADELTKAKPDFPVTTEQAKEIVSENGFYGVKQTSDRLSQFVLLGAGDDESLLRAGREGIINGFNEAEKVWGEKLPDIAYETLERALKLIDDRFAELGYSILALKA